MKKFARQAIVYMSALLLMFASMASAQPDSGTPFNLAACRGDGVNTFIAPPLAWVMVRSLGGLPPTFYWMMPCLCIGWEPAVCESYNRLLNDYRLGVGTSGTKEGGHSYLEHLIDGSSGG